MASGFPGSIDNFTDPLSNSSLSSPSHAGQHADLNDAVEKIETYMGLVKVIPTGATNGTVSATGTVTVGNAVSSVTVSGAFSALYDCYRVEVFGGVGSTGQAISVRLGAATTGYYGNLVYWLYSSTTTNVVNQANVANWGYVGVSSTNTNSMSFDLQGPNLAKTTVIRSMGYVNASTTGEMGIFQGFLNNTTQFTDFTLSVAGTMTGGSIRVYGYRN
jgi:hypothetical protein